MTNTEDKPVRVRMAPSPTGSFHVGSARTALFNYLFARHHDKLGGATFVLRVEDTDQQRNEPEFEKIIYQAMDWLGLHPDEGPQNGGAFGPYRQSERFYFYQDYCESLLETGAAYKAFETPDELAAMREAQKQNKQPPRYNGAHRDLSEQERLKFEAEDQPFVVRLRIPDGETGWQDLVRGRVVWQNTEIDDFVIQKSDGSPTYNFACAVDDALMRITHVIRGEDGLSNTPRQLLLYRALDFDAPQFAHLPFLLGADRSKLSKRHGAVNLLQFRDEGIWPDAMFNYLALLGWNPGDGETQEIFSREELIERFSLDGVNKAGAIFDAQKLAWVNTQYLKTMPIERFVELAQPHLKSDVSPTEQYSLHALDMARERIHALEEIGPAADYFFDDVYEIDAKGEAKHLTSESRALLSKLRESLSALEEWNHDSIEAALRELSEKLEIKPAALIHPARMAVSGRTVGPSVFELLEMLGRDRVLLRLEKFGA